MPGFGRTPFGRTTFGKSDYGNDTIINVFSPFALEQDSTGHLNRYLHIIRNTINTKRDEIDDMINLFNPDKIRSDLLQYLGQMIGINDLDENEPEQFQRTLVRDAVQYYRLKGTSDAYKIRGLISGFEVQVTKIWKVGSVYTPYIPSEHLYEYPPGSFDYGIFYTDIPPESVSGISVSGGDGHCDYCLTSYIKLNYTLRKIPEETVVGNLLDRVIQKIREVTPIHIRDLFIDLSIFIVTDPLGVKVSMTADELCIHATSFSDRYDMQDADIISTDRKVFVKS